MGTQTKTKARKIDPNKVAISLITILAIGLFMAGFIVPPTGIIDGSVLTAGGIMFGFAGLFLALHAIDRGLDAKVTHGQTVVELQNDDKDED